MDLIFYLEVEKIIIGIFVLWYNVFVFEDFLLNTKKTSASGIDTCLQQCGSFMFLSINCLSKLFISAVFNMDLYVSL